MEIAQTLVYQLALPLLESGFGINYNLAVRNLSSKSGFIALILVASLGGCKSKDPKLDQTAKDVVGAADRVKPEATAPAGPVDKTPIAGVDIAALDAAKQETFYKLVGSLSSPCGKAHSLRTSVATDQTCKRAPFAVKYVESLLEDGATEDETKEQYDAKYKPKPGVNIKIDGTPSVGSADAPIKLVEFFDYACPACVAFRKELDKLKTDRGNQFVIYYKMFPLERIHPDSKTAAQAVLAAQKQGKFEQMHTALFDKQTHKKEQVIGLAAELGLDPAKFLTDFDEAAVRISDDQKDGDTVGVDGTPALFFNGREYKGPRLSKYLAMWIDEEMAVNR
jgi:protein-disulfide isomerase